MVFPGTFNCYFITTFLCTVLMLYVAHRSLKKSSFFYCNGQRWQTIATVTCTSRVPPNIFRPSNSRRDYWNRASSYPDSRASRDWKWLIPGSRDIPGIFNDYKNASKNVSKFLWKNSGFVMAPVYGPCIVSISILPEIAQHLQMT